MDTKILVGLPRTEHRNSTNDDYFDKLRIPPGSIIMKVHLQSPARARNMMIEMALEKNCTHIFFMDDDICPLPDTLENLMKVDKNIISALYLSRQYPHKPFIFENMDSTGYCSYQKLTPEKSGIIETVAGGLGCILIKTEVFNLLDRPYIRLGEIEQDHWCDDIGFFKRLKDAGIKSYCDLDNTVGHIGSVIIRPHKINNKWYTSYSAYSNEVVTFPQITNYDQLTEEVDELVKK